MVAWTKASGALLIFALSTSSSLAVDLHKSRLTPIDLAACKQTAKHKDGGAWICPGLRGYPVYFAEGDLRQMMAFGPAPQKRKSATETLGAFNTIFSGKRRPTVEWRVESSSDGKVVPYATIVRYYTNRDGEKSEVLVITKVTARESCRLAVIDTKANNDAMAQARLWAIAEARKRSCPEEAVILGSKGKGLL